MQEARDAAKDKVTVAVQLVETGMKCGDCGRVCYNTWDNRCAVYAHKFMVEHAKLLASSFFVSYPIHFVANMFCRLEESLALLRTRSRTRSVQDCWISSNLGGRLRGLPLTGM